MYTLHTRDPARCSPAFARTRLYYVIAPHDHTYRVGQEIATDRGTFRVTHPGRTRYLDEVTGRLSLSVSVAADLPADVAAELEAARIARRDGVLARRVEQDAFFAADPASLSVEQIFARTAMLADRAAKKAESSGRRQAQRGEIERIRSTPAGLRTPSDQALLEHDERRRAKRRVANADRKARKGGTTDERIAAGKTRLAAYHALMRADPATLTAAQRSERETYRARISAGTRKGLAKRKDLPPEEREAKLRERGIVITPEQTAANAAFLAQLMHGTKK